jgi:hypothetical protein
MNYEIDHQLRVIRLDPTGVSPVELSEFIQSLREEERHYKIQIARLKDNLPLLNLAVYNPKSGKQYTVDNVKNPVNEILDNLTMFLDVDLNLETTTGNVVLPYVVLNESIIAINEKTELHSEQD